MALAGIVSFWTQDESVIAEVMRKSALNRDKYERHDYLPRTIQNALAGGGETYNGTPEPREPRAAGDPAVAAGLSSESWTAIDLLALDDRPPLSPTLGGFLYPGLRHVISGEPETLKTWVALAAAKNVMESGEAVLWIDFEMGRYPFMRRLRNLGIPDETIRERLIYMEPLGPAFVRARAAVAEPTVIVQNLIAQCQERGVALVVVDSFTSALAVHGLNDNAAVEVDAFFTEFVNHLSVKIDATMVLLDHVSKADKASRGMYSIGSSRKIGATDVHLGAVIEKPLSPGGEGIVRLERHKDRHGSYARPNAARVTFTSHAEGGISYEIDLIDPDAVQGPFIPTFLMERVSRTLETFPGQLAATKTALVKEVNGKKQTVHQAVDRLIEFGFIQREGESGLRLARAYREGFDLGQPSEPAEVENGPRDDIPF